MRPNYTDDHRSLESGKKGCLNSQPVLILSGLYRGMFAEFAPWNDLRKQIYMYNQFMEMFQFNFKLKMYAIGK